MKGKYAIISSQNLFHIGESKLLKTLALAQSFLVSGPVGTDDRIFVLSQISAGFEMGTPLRRERERGGGL
jgi:hypothetical protein